MKTFIFAGIFGIFLTLVVIGVFSVSPLMESDSADRLASSIASLIIPQNTTPTPIPPGSTATKLAQTTSLSPHSNSPGTPQVLGLQTNTGSVNADTLYGLINGDRRDQKRSILRVDASLEQAAATINASRSTTQIPEVLDEASTIEQTGYHAKTYTILEARSVDSDWKTVQSWQNDERNALMLRSNSFSDMGLSVLCDAQQEKDCTVLLILATPQ